MEKIYEKAEQIHVAAIVLYPGEGTGTGKYYKTSEEATAAAEGTEISAEDLFQLFVKGVIVKTGDVYRKPVACTKAGVLTFASAS